MSGAMCGASTLASSTFRVAAAGFATLGVSIRGVSILAASGLGVTPSSGAADFGASGLSASDLVASGLIASGLIVRSAGANAIFGEALASASRTGTAASPPDKDCPSAIVSSLPIKCPYHAPGDWKPWALPTGYYLAGGRPTDQSPGSRAPPFHKRGYQTPRYRCWIGGAAASAWDEPTHTTLPRSIR